MVFAATAGKWVANSREVSQFMHCFFRWSVARPLCLASQWPGSWDGALVDHGGPRWSHSRCRSTNEMGRRQRVHAERNRASYTPGCTMRVYPGGIEVPRWPDRRAEMNSVLSERVWRSRSAWRMASVLCKPPARLVRVRCDGNEFLRLGRSSKLWFGKLKVFLFARERVASHCVA